MVDGSQESVSPGSGLQPYGMGARLKIHKDGLRPGRVFIKMG